MDSRRDKKLSLGRRLPPGRTYGSKDSSGRVGRPNHDDLRTVPKTPSAKSHQPSGMVHPRNQAPSIGSAECESRIIYTDSIHGIRSRSAEEISRMVRSAGEGGQRGRAAAVAVAQACKSVVTRKAMDVDGFKSVLDELSKVTQKMLRGGDSQQQQDEAIVHCLAVSMFTLSKDRSLVQRFDVSVLSTLAFLIEGYGRGEAGESSARGLTAAMGATSLQSCPVLSGEREDKKRDGTEPMGLLGEGQKHRNAHAARVHLRTSLEDPRQGKDERNTSTRTRNGETFNGEDSDALYEKSPGSVCSADGIGSVGTSFVGNGLSDKKAGETRGSVHTLACHHATDHGSAGVMVRARMLLDITDMLPWGLANRHLVSAADLGLATMLNVVGRNSPENEAAGAANGAGAGDSVEEDFSTQGSAPSRCDSGTVSTDGLSESVKASTTGNSAVLLELNRLDCIGFLVPLVVAGASVLEDLAASRRVSARGAATDPSSLRQVHRLLLALRLLDLATLENSPEGDAATGYSEGNATEPDRGSKLAGALLRVVSRCLAVNAGNRDARRNEESAVAGATVGQGRLGVRLGRPSRGQRQPHADEVAIRVQECLLAALRVLVNLTHDDAKVCAVVGARGGLETLMRCLVAHSECEVQDSDDDSSPLAGCWGMDSKASTGGDARLPGADASIDDADDGAGRSLRAGGDFDAQILSMGALINCVELQESAENCAVMGTLVVSPPPTGQSAELSRGRLRGHRRTCLAPEFLGRLLVFCTRSFSRHLEISRPVDDTGDEDEEETSTSPSKRPNDRIKGGNAPHRQNREDADSSAQAVAPPTHPVTPTVSLRTKKQQQQQEDEEEEEMSHSEGAELVLGGHCALLLGLLIRDQEEIRHLALSVLPERVTTLIVRVLEAFMALQYQAGVLTEEVALKVQSLVEELEEMEGLPEPDEESDPFELDSEEEGPLATLPSTGSATALPRGKGRKRPRGPATSTVQLGTFPTPPSEQWAADAEGNDCAGGFSLTEIRTRSSFPREVRALPSWLPQANGTAGSCPSVSDNRASPWKTSPPPHATEEAQSAASRLQDEVNADETQPLDRCSPGSSKKSKRPFGARGVGWRVGGAGGRLGLGCGGTGSALGTRNWLGGSPPRAYGGRHPRTYGRQAWTKSGESLSGLRSLSVRGGNGSGGEEGKVAKAGIPAEAERNYEGGGVGKANVFCMTSDESEDGLLKEGSGAGDDKGGNEGEGDNGSSVRIGVRPTGGRGRVNTAPTEGTKSIFDLNWSSDESPAKLDSHAGRPKVSRVTHGLFGATAGDAIGSAGGRSQASGDARAPADSRPNQKRAPRGPRPPRAAGKNLLSTRGIGPRSGGTSRDRGMSRASAGAANASWGLEGTTSASVKRRVASLSLLRGVGSKSSAHNGAGYVDEGLAPPSLKSEHLSEGRDRKNAARAGQRRRADSSNALVGISARGRKNCEIKTANAGKSSNRGNTGNAGNIFKMVDSDGDDDNASSKEAAHRSVFDFGDDSE